MQLVKHQVKGFQPAVTNQSSQKRLLPEPRIPEGKVTTSEAARGFPHLGPVQSPCQGNGVDKEKWDHNQPVQSCKKAKCVELRAKGP